MSSSALGSILGSLLAGCKCLVGGACWSLNNCGIKLKLRNYHGTSDKGVSGQRIKTILLRTPSLFHIPNHSPIVLIHYFCPANDGNFNNLPIKDEIGWTLSEVPL